MTYKFICLFIIFITIFQEISVQYIYIYTQFKISPLWRFINIAWQIRRKKITYFKYIN